MLPALLFWAVGPLPRHSLPRAQVPGQEGPSRGQPPQKDGASPGTGHIVWGRPGCVACLLSLEVGE